MELWVSFLLVALFTTFSPGPAVLFTLQNMLSAGWRAAALGALGNATGLLLVALSGFAGISVLLQQSTLLFSVLKIVGAAYLVYLALQQWRQAADLKVLTVLNTAAKQAVFRRGVLVALTNPKAWLFISALLPQFIDLRLPVAPQFLLLAALFATCSLVSHAAWMLLAGFGLRHGASLRQRQLLARIQSLVLAAVGCSLWWTMLPA